MRSIIAATFVFVVFCIAGCQTAPTKKTDSPAVVTKMGVSEISPTEARTAVEAAYSQFVDVRTQEEYASGHANRARNIPLDTLMTDLDKLEKNEPVYLICQSGTRSKKAAQILVDAGFSQAISISGGTKAWEAAGLPMAK
jgi:rhodanese-related sulfurtransferase